MNSSPLSQPEKVTVVALFVRPPVVGEVKTRLAAVLGAEAACALYRAMVADILRNIRGAGVPIHLFHDGRDERLLPRSWRAAADRVIPQEGADIGERMAAAFQHCFAEKIGQVVLAGSDIPGLGARDITGAIKALADHDAAITPVLDGGYCLIALKRERFCPALFQDMPWSTGRVLHLTLERFAACGLKLRQLPALRDIDTLTDLVAYQQAPFGDARTTNRAIARFLGPAA